MCNKRTLKYYGIFAACVRYGDLGGNGDDADAAEDDEGNDVVDLYSDILGGDESSDTTKKAASRSDSAPQPATTTEQSRSAGNNKGASGSNADSGSNEAVEGVKGSGGLLPTPKVVAPPVPTGPTGMSLCTLNG